MPRAKKLQEEVEESDVEIEMDDDSDDEEGDNNTKIAKCLRKVANMSSVKPALLMDTKMFNPKMLKLMMPRGAPKLQMLFDKINELDAKDMRTHKKHFKHMIFTDIDSSNYGAKLIASAFVAQDFTPVFTKELSFKSDEALMGTQGKNFGLLLSKTFGAKSMNVKFKKAQMHKYNQRPENINGDLMRFIILDQGFKEGIDLFDVKYVHLFEPLVSPADQKQAIGRGTRFCGQKGLTFHPRFGWPLYVFRYDVKLAKPINGKKTMFELFIEYSNIDLRKVIFASEVEKATIEASVDHQLTKEIHSFEIEAPPPVLSPKVSGGADRCGERGVFGGATAKRGRKVPVVEEATKSKSPAKSLVASPVASPKNAIAPSKIMSHDQMQTYITKHFKSFAYPHAKLENLCDQSAPDGKLTFTPTQDFVRHYFRPESAYKGLLLFHSVGSGKTCTAIATATSSFEREGYNILWVTRHTLKADIWKNMYGQICSTVIQEGLDSGKLKLPNKISGPMRYLSDRWIEPISYKQFSNMLLKNNKYYNEIVKRNGEKDPLRKTLVIIDEAHKLYAPNVTGSEKPDTDILESMIQNSYKVSGKDSVRILLMTATPYTEDAMEMMKLLNNLRPKGDALPTEFEKFAKVYLDNNGYFTAAGVKKFQDQVAGYVSYINRSQDGRNFAHPIIENVFADMTKQGKEEPTKHEDNKVKDITASLKDMRAVLRDNKAEARDALRDAKAECKERANAKLAKCKETAIDDYKSYVANIKETKADALADCKSVPKNNRVGCRGVANAQYKEDMADARYGKTAALNQCKEQKKACSIDSAFLGKTQAAVDIQKAAIDDAINIRGEIKEKLKMIRVNSKDATVQQKALRQSAKALRFEKNEIVAKMKPLNAKLKAAKKDEDKKKEIRKVLLPLRAESKRISEEIKTLRASVTNLTTDKKLSKIDVGRASLGDVSQENAMLKKCFGEE